MTRINQSGQSSKRALEPYERISEVLFGLIMVLTFTGSLSVAEAGRPEVRTMLIGALGCNLAWGIIDSILYLMGCLSEQGRGIRALRALHAAKAEAGHRVIASVLPPLMAETLGADEYEPMRKKLVQLREPPAHPRLGKDEWRGALAVFLWVFFTTLPVAIPFIFMTDVARATRVSNAIAIGMLFLTGYAFGRVAEYHAWLTGLATGAPHRRRVLVGMTIALGG